MDAFNRILSQVKQSSSKWASNQASKDSIERLTTLANTSNSNHVVHLLPDNFYTKRFLKEFKSTDSIQQTLIIFRTDFTQPCKYIPNELIQESNAIVAQPSIVGKNIFWGSKIERAFSKAELIIAQYFREYFIDIIDRCPNAKFAWCPWGGDIYYLYMESYFDDLNKQIMDELSIESVAFDILPLYNRFASNVVNFFSRRLDLLFSTWSDYCSLVKKFPSINPIFIESIHHISDDHPSKYMLKKSEKMDYLILGNSLSPSNNHFSALLTLFNLRYKGIIFIPISYGLDIKSDYTLKLKSFAHKLFKDNVIFLESFMPIGSYVEIFSVSKHYISNHLRAQGGSNSLIAYYTNTNIYMPEDAGLRNHFDVFYRYGGLDFPILNLNKGIKENQPQFDLNCNLNNIHNQACLFLNSFSSIMHHGEL